MTTPIEEDHMAADDAFGPIRLYMSMSLDGFITGPDDRRGQELGAGGWRLFDWLDHRHGDGASGQVYREATATGAVISGRRTFELAGRWQGDHHDGVAINVLTHHLDPDDRPPGSARFFTDVGVCAAEARAAAGGRAVLVHGAGAAQALLRAGLLDELEIHLVPVVLGKGRRLFDETRVELRQVRQLTDQGVTHLRYAVERAEAGRPR
ncbi:dihydrofolate reductase family protein [Amycolatopsis rhabdoformis]|uniref:Dihydrofolate reductase family protein n=1 Tax=Amycolatopsis rhabdoformis TaxID=1448059 RepID=A0ABZ1I7N8_9PSEU|nr:dihydrofolate reductase family protein [Amycolatopsis rhabdoformis]WSE29883.1 dihydrofolate reductase family protein [Amycolatopsis rhabdoformis]